jgi:predicted alpha/beta-hydrolase family hydrolase
VTTPAGLILTHGAGGGADHHTLLALESGLDLPVRSLTFPYRAEGRRAPDRANKIVPFIVEQTENFADELGATPGEIVSGGRSMGGRMCSMAVAEGLPSAGLVLLSYPLHPSGKPEKLRVEHFGDISVPVLFVSGDRDPFGKPDEFAVHVGEIAGEVTQCWLEREAHDPKRSDELIVEAVSSWLQAC